MPALRSRSASWWSPGSIYRTISACRRCSRQSCTVLHNTTRRLHAAPSRRACHGPARLMTPYSNISLLNHTDIIACYSCSPDQSREPFNQELRNIIQLLWKSCDVKFRFFSRFLKYLNFCKEHRY